MANTSFVTQHGSKIYLKIKANAINRIGILTGTKASVVHDTFVHSSENKSENKRALVSRTDDTDLMAQTGVVWKSVFPAVKRTYVTGSVISNRMFTRLSKTQTRRTALF